MPRPGSQTRFRLVALIGILAAAWQPLVFARDAAAATFSQEEIEQVVAPIALYPDPLLAQVLMASTYPLEVVEAARFAEQHPDLKGDALDKALQDETWDASVKSLVSFPQVLTMMNEKLDWTQKLGDAFLAQQSDVMDGVQRLRAKAKAEGNLESNKEQTVTVEQAPPPPANVTVQQAPANDTVIVIQPANPQVVYVPTYNPTVVYGAWPYPAYPPYYYYPPGYVMGASLISFGIGMAVGSALWGGCHWGWGHGDIKVNVNHYNNFNKNVNRNWNRNQVNNKFKNGTWQHDASHRKGVQYRDQATQKRFDRTGPAGKDSREAFRGRAEQGRQQIKREGAAGIQRDLARTQPAGQRPGGPQRPSAGQRPSTGERPSAGQRPSAGERPSTGQRPSAGERPGAGQRPSTGQQRPGGAGERPSARSPSSPDRGRGSPAFQGVGQGSQVRRDSSRGASSRASASRMGGGGGGGGMRGGGGGMRGGGGGGRRR